MNLHTIQHILGNSALDNLDLKVLLAFVLNTSKEKLIINLNYELTEDEYTKFNQLYQRRLLGEPISYITGIKEFYSYEFKVTPDTLIPRPETELLVDNILELTNATDRVLELGTGSGAIAISCKLQKPGLQIIATDNYLDTLKIAEENARLHQVEIGFIKSNWYDNINGKFDLIASNPPYIDNEDEHLLNLKYEPPHALTDFADGLTCIKHIISNASAFLESNGYLILEHGYNQGHIVRGLMRSFSFTQVKTILDYAGIERITVGQIYKEI